MGEDVDGCAIGLFPRQQLDKCQPVAANIAVDLDILVFLSLGSFLPIAVAHGEGRAEFPSADAAAACERSGLTALRYVNNDHSVARTYPANPSGTPFGIAALTNRDGRITITMPHPERSYRYLQNSWRPREAGENSGWTRLFRNARRFVD